MLSSVIFRFLFVLSVLHLSHSSLQDKQVESSFKNHDYKIAKAIAYAIKNFIRKRIVEIDVISVTESVLVKRYYMDMLDGILPHLGMAATISLCDFREERHFIFVLAESPLSFRSLLLSTRNKQYDFTGDIIVYINAEEFDVTEVEKIFKDCLNHHIINISIIIKMFLNDYIALETYYPFTNTKCFGYRGSTECLHFDGSFITKDNNKCHLYPNKLSNFNGCELIFNIFDMPPYLTFKRTPKGITSVRGFEGEVITTLAKKLNFKATFRTPDSTQTLERVKLLTSERANVSIGRLQVTSIIQRNVSSSTDYYKSELVLVTRSGRPFNSLERVFSPASSGSWFSLAFLIILAYVVVIVVYKKFPTARDLILGPGNRIPTYWICVTAVGGPVEYRPRRTFTRYLLLQWMSSFFLLRASYQTFVYKSIRMGWKRNTANSLEDILMYEYTLTATLETRNSLSNISRIAGLIRIHNGTDLEALQELENNYEKISVITPNEVYRYYKQMTVHSNLSVIKEALLEHTICMHFQRNSYLKDAFDPYLVKLRDSGLLSHWRKIYLPMTDKTEDATVLPKKIKFADLEGYFQLYCFGIIISFVCLGIEFLSLKVQFFRRMFT